MNLRGSADRGCRRERRSRGMDRKAEEGAGLVSPVTDRQRSGSPVGRRVAGFALSAEPLKDVLEDLVPEPPDTDFAAGARSLARRTKRRRGIALAAASAVAVTAVVVPMALWGGDSPRPTAGSANKPSSGPMTPAALECPPTSKDRAERAEPTGGPIELGAVRALLCPVYGNFGDFQAPQDALEQAGVAVLFEKLASLPEAQKNPICTSDGGIAYRIVLEYPDQSQRSFIGENYGCHQLRTTDGTFTKAKEVWDTYLRQLRKQRADTEPASSVTASTSCDQGRSESPVGQVRDGLVDAILCVRYDTTIERSTQQIAIPAALLEELKTDLDANPGNAKDEYTCDRRNGPDRYVTIIATTTWGDVVSLRALCDLVFTVYSYGENRPSSWQPTSANQQALEKLLTQAPSRS